jgi:hypothetical protein
MCVTAGECAKANCWPHGLITFCQNQSRKVKAMLLKCMLMKGENHGKFLTNTITQLLSIGITLCKVSGLLDAIKRIDFEWGFESQI